MLIQHVATSCALQFHFESLNIINQSQQSSTTLASNELQQSQTPLKRQHNGKIAIEDEEQTSVTSQQALTIALPPEQVQYEHMEPQPAHLVNMALYLFQTHTNPTYDTIGVLLAKCLRVEPGFKVVDGKEVPECDWLTFK